MIRSPRTSVRVPNRWVAAQFSAARVIQVDWADLLGG